MKFDDTKYGVNKNIKYVRDAKIKCYDVGEIIDKYKYLRNIKHCCESSYSVFPGRLDGAFCCEIQARRCSKY
jgi:hypothetical protein